jgi:hypothetical protein
MAHSVARTQIVPPQTGTNRRLKPERIEADLAFGDNAIAGAVAGKFVAEDRFWDLAEGDGDPSALALDLVPCEGRGRELVGLYIERARTELGLYEGAEHRRELAGLGVVQLGLAMVWSPGGEPLTSRRRKAGAPLRLPSFAQYGRDPKPGEPFTSPLEALERVLALKCAVSRCNYRAQAGAGHGRRSSRPVCCKEHEPLHGARSKRRVRDLLATAAAIVDVSNDDWHADWQADVRARRGPQ